MVDPVAAGDMVIVAPNTTTAAPNTTTRSTSFADVEPMAGPVATSGMVIVAPNTTTAAPNTTTRSTSFAGVESMVDPVAAGELVIDDSPRLFEAREGAAAHRVHLNAWQAAGAACGAILFSLAMVAFLVRGNILVEGGQQPLISEVEEELESVE